MLLLQKNLSLLMTVAMSLAPMARTSAVAAAVTPVEHWSGANQSAGGLVTGDAYFEQNSSMKLPSQTLRLRSVKLMTFPANLGYASGTTGHLYRVASGGAAVLPGGNFLCGGAAKVGARPTYLLVSHFTSKYQPGQRLVEIGIYQGTAMPTGSNSDKLCATVGYVAV